MESKSFYQNVFLLTQAVQPSDEFLKHFKEGMFDKPNTVGFLHATHFLLTIYDPERFKKHMQWPLFCKKAEAKYRTDVKDFLTAVALENSDLDFPQILASHLLHASGNKFMDIMWKLSTAALRTYIKRETKAMLLNPKAGAGENLSRKMLNSFIEENIRSVDELNEKMVRTETEAMEYTKEAANSIDKMHKELFSTRQSLVELSLKPSIHPSLQLRLKDPTDLEIVKMWESSIDDNFKYLKRKLKRLSELAELSTNVASMVGSIVSTDANILDGNRLPIIDIQSLSEFHELSRETQVMLFRLYENDTLVLENFLSLFILVLSDLRRYCEKNSFPDFTGCDSQIAASLEDTRAMNDRFEILYDRIAELTCSVNNGNNKEAFSSSYSAQANFDNEIFDSVLLKSSPTININWNAETDKSEQQKRFELTPVENVHRELFARHRRNNKIPNQVKLRPKLLISRINFDDTITSTLSERSSPLMNRTVLSGRKIEEWNASRRGIYSRVFSTYKKSRSTMLDSTSRCIQTSSRLNSITDVSTSDVYNVSQLRSHLAFKTKYSNNRGGHLSVDHNNAAPASSTLNDDEKSVSSVESFEPLYEMERDSLNNAEQRGDARWTSKNPKNTEKPKDKRFSISDLVERYKKVKQGCEASPKD